MIPPSPRVWVSWKPGMDTVESSASSWTRTRATGASRHRDGTNNGMIITRPAMAMLFDGILAMAGLVMIIPLFVPSRWRLAPVALVRVQDEALDSTVSIPGFQDTQTLGDGGIMSDWAQTRPQPRVNPGGLSQAPWGPVDPGAGGSAGPV